MPKVGDLRVVEFDPDVFEIECFANHEIEGVWVSEPFWALPNWLNLDIPEFAGPFASHKEASSQIRIIRNNNDPRLDKIK